MVHIVACDDESEFLDLLETELKCHISFPYSLKKADSIERLEQILEENPNYFDILLMDIKVYKDNGIDVAADILKVTRNLKIIFITGYIGEYYEAVFLQLRPYGVLSKPVNWNNLDEILERAVTQHKKERYLPVKIRSGVVNVDVDKIIYVESIKRTTVLHIGEETMTCYMSLTEMEKMLPPHFLRCHKSYIVNMDEIKSFFKEIVTKNDELISVSKNKAKESKLKYFKYIGMGL